MPTSRDPRIDPKTGDRLRMETTHGDFDDVTVEWGSSGYPDFMVGYKVAAWRSAMRIDILLWREWAKNAEVLHVEP